MFSWKKEIINQLLVMMVGFYEWNIDGMSEHQIINLLHEMMMVANAYRIKTSNSDLYTIGTLVIGFTGLLKGWWDHYLSQNDRIYIKCKKDNNKRKRNIYPNL